jgi:hypothetical protein
MRVRGPRHSCQRNGEESNESLGGTMQTLRRRIEKLERVGSASDSPLWRPYVMPAGFRLAVDLAKADEALGHGGGARGCSLVVLDPDDVRLRPAA